MAKSFPILCGSIAGSIGGMGVKMHNAAFKHLNLPYTYVSFEPETLKGAVDAMRTLNIRGLAVTMPYKQDVIQYLDDVDDMSKEIGAINTIVNTEGRLVGYNTDVYGFTKTIQKVTALENKKVVVLGAGGIAKTIIWGLKQYTKQITVYNIIEQEGKDVADKFNIQFGGNISDVHNYFDYDILINATSVGFKTQDTILNRNQIKPNSIVLDVVFVPTCTTFMKEAEAVGCTVLSGTQMIMNQACKQFELYTNIPAPVEIYESVMNDVEQNKPT